MAPLGEINGNLHMATHRPCPADFRLAPSAAVKHNPERNSSAEFQGVHGVKDYGRGSWDFEPAAGVKWEGSGESPNLASELWVLLETSELASENQVLLRTFRATVDVRSQGSGEPERAGGVSGGAGRRL